jgi:hypothetical protein
VEHRRIGGGLYMRGELLGKQEGSLSCFYRINEIGPDPFLLLCPERSFETIDGGTSDIRLHLILQEQSQGQLHCFSSLIKLSFMHLYR